MIKPFEGHPIDWVSNHHLFEIMASDVASLKSKSDLPLLTKHKQG